MESLGNGFRPRDRSNYPRGHPRIRCYPTAIRRRGLAHPHAAETSRSINVVEPYSGFGTAVQVSVDRQREDDTNAEEDDIANPDWRVEQHCQVQPGEREEYTTADDEVLTREHDEVITRDTSWRYRWYQPRDMCPGDRVFPIGMVGIAMATGADSARVVTGGPNSTNPTQTRRYSPSKGAHTSRSRSRDWVAQTMTEPRRRPDSTTTNE